MATSGRSNLLYQSMTDFATLSGGLSVTRNADSWAATVQNLHSNGKALRVVDPSGSSFFAVRRSSAGTNNVVVIAAGADGDPIPSGNLLLVSKTENEATGQMVSLEYNNTGDGGSSNADVSTLRVVARSMTGGNVQHRPIESHMIKSVGTGDKPTHGLEVSMQSSIADAATAFWHNGIRVANLGGTWAIPTPQRIGNLLYIGADEYGAENGIMYQGTFAESFPILFRVTKTGVVEAKHDIYSNKLGSTYRVGIGFDHNTAPSGDTWASLDFDSTSDRKAMHLGAALGGSAYLPVLMTPFGGGVGISISPVVLAAQSGLIATALQVGGVGTISALKATVVTPSTNYSSLGPETDELWYRKTSGGTKVQMLDATTTKVISQAQVVNTSNQSINDNTVTTLAFTSENWDVGGWHDNSTNNNRLTAPVTGRYCVTARATFASNTVGLRSLLIRKNGTQVAEDTVVAVNGTVTSLTTVATVDLTAAEYVDCAVYQNSGGALNILGAAPNTPNFDIVLQL